MNRPDSCALLTRDIAPKASHPNFRASPQLGAGHGLPVQSCSVARTSSLSPCGRRPCKSVVKRKQNSPDARYGGARKSQHLQNPQLATCASRRWFLPLAEPDIHLLSPARVGLLRRLSLCSPPVPKQSEGSLGSLISFAQSATCGTWQPARRVILISFSYRPAFLSRRRASPFRRNEVLLSAIHGQQIRDHLPGHG